MSTARRESRRIVDEILRELEEIPPEKRNQYIAFIIWELIKTMCELQKRIEVAE